MPHKSDYIDVIISRMSSVSEDRFQDISTDILSFYYRQIGLKFEKVGAARGDFKNDGWVPEKSIYYQIYSPIGISDSFVNNLYNKFQNDFIKLAEHVFLNGKWSGLINEFYFLVNTRDRDIPRDENRIVDTTKTLVETKYAATINVVEVINKDYFRNLLLDLNDDQLNNLVILLGFSGDLEILDITPRSFTEFIGVLCDTVLSHKLNGSLSFDKIPDEEKISINDLQDREERINKITAHLNVVDEAVDSFTISGINQKKIQGIIDYCVEVYEELKRSFHGAQLYDAIIDKITSSLPNSINQRNNVELFVVYVFDRCDIFERVNDVTA